MPFVKRDEQTQKITGLYFSKQPGVAEEWLEENAPDIVEYRAAQNVPFSVTPRQARLALLQQGLLSAVNSHVAQESEAAQITWEFATEIRRDNAIIAAAATALNLTSEQVDQLFILAATFVD